MRRIIRYADLAALVTAKRIVIAEKEGQGTIEWRTYKSIEIFSPRAMTRITNTRGSAGGGGRPFTRWQARTAASCPVFYVS